MPGYLDGYVDRMAAAAARLHNVSLESRPALRLIEDYGRSPRVLIYADPPYLGCCKLYDHHHPDGLCWDNPDTHQRLIDRLVGDYPDGWALSCHTPSLRVLLPLCPDTVRIGAWVKPFHIYKKGVRPAYAWEPLLYCGGRNQKHPPPAKGGQATTPKDFVAANITLKRGLTGCKPPAFNRWVLDMLGFIDGTDTLDDLYPGTAGMADALAAAPFNYGESTA